MYLRLLVLATIVCMIPAFAQLTGTPATTDGPFQVKIFPNLAAGDSVINIGNTGASATTTGAGITGSADGNLCVNVYVFSPDEQEVACCTCTVTPNAVQTVSARQLISKTLTPAVPTAITVKLVSTVGATCNASTVAPATLGTGLLAFGTNIHAAPVGGSVTAGTFDTTETPFRTATLSAAELTRITVLCGFIQANGTGFGICPGCTTGAAGASRQ